MRFDVGIDSTCIGFEVGTILFGRDFDSFLRRYSEAQNSLFPIMLEKSIAEDFRNFTGSESSHHVHLPQSILSGHISLRKEQVFETGRVNCGNTMLVTSYCHSR